MKVPAAIAKRLSKIDRNLTAEWDPAKERFRILRRNPVKPELPPDTVFLWQDPVTKEFLPLDERLFEILEETDCQRKFRGRDEKYFGMLLEQELEACEETDRARREAPIDERFKALEDGMAWLIKKDPYRVKAHEVERMSV